MALPKTYSTGTVSVSNGSTAVTGVGTSWLSTVKADDVFRKAGYSVRVASVTDDTHLVLAENWPGTTLSGSAYEIAITFDGPEFLQTARKIWSQLSSLLFYVADATSATYQDFYEQTTNGTNKFRLSAAANLAADVTGYLTAAAADLWTRWTSATVSTGASLDFPEATANGTNKVRVVSAAALAADRAFTLPDSDVTFGSKGVALLATTTNAGAQGAIGVREVLVADRTYYVRADGSDSNTGLVDSAGGAFLTTAKALTVAAALDCSTFNVTIQVRSGTFTGAAVLPAMVGSGTFTLTGDTTTPSNVIISTTSADAVSGLNAGGWTVQGFRLQTTTGGNGLVASGRTTIYFNNIDFGTVAGAHHIYAANGSQIIANGNWSISGNTAYAHMTAAWGALIQAYSRTITLVGARTFSIFAYAATGNIDTGSLTFSGPTGTFTVTIASPGVFTKNSHGFLAGTPVVFTTTGALPTGLTAGTTYYVIATGLTTNTFQVAATVGGAAINTSGTQSGTHTVTAGAIGSKYQAVINGVINSSGGGANYFPGNSAGTAAQGGQYN